jgi:alkylhydroperoxidase family enzyme
MPADASSIRRPSSSLDRLSATAALPIVPDGLSTTRCWRFPEAASLLYIPSTPGARSSLRGRAMPRINPLAYDEMTADARAAHDAHLRIARITNMKRTLLHSVPAFEALMCWYSLRDTVHPFLGERLTTLVAHAVSSETDCLICSTFFRRLLIDSGEDPDSLPMDEREVAVVTFGRALAATPHRVPDALYEHVAAHFSDEQMVALTAFGAMMVATNVINNVLQVPLDDYLEPYRKQPSAERAGAHG